MKNYILLIFTLVVFVIAFNSIVGSKQEKINIKHIQAMTEYCKQRGAVFYKEPGTDGVCVMRREKIE